MSANPTQVADGSTTLDQGRGYVDARAAAAALATGTVSDALPLGAAFTRSVTANVEREGLLVVRGGRVERRVTDLKPGQRAEIVYHVRPNTSRVTIELRNVAPELETSRQNRLFGDQLMLMVHSAKTSRIGQGDYRVFRYVRADGSYAVEDPEPGLMRITLLGGSFDAGMMSADVEVSSINGPAAEVTAHGQIVTGQVVEVPVTIAPGVERAEFRLSFRNDWSRYPSSNLDLTLVDPEGTVALTAATLDAPEAAIVEHPASGTWTVQVSGTDVRTRMDRFKLRISLDGRVAR
jgi:hypothetical protein